MSNDKRMNIQSRHMLHSDISTSTTSSSREQDNDNRK